jgi:elongation factor G
MSVSSELDPIMKVEVVTPDDYVADIVVDLKGRLGKVQRTDKRDDVQVIHALVPKANMLGYVSTLRSITQGQASCTIQYDQ